VKTRILQRQGNLADALAAIQESVMLLDTGGSRAGTDSAQSGDRSGLPGADSRRRGRDQHGLPEQAEKPLQRAFGIADALVHQESEQSQRCRINR